MGGGVLALVLVLSGCGATQKEPTAGAAYNRTDMQFAQDMIPRQRQAATMSALAKTRSSNPAVVALAARIRDAQGPCTRDMRWCLTRWDDIGPSGMMSPSGANGMMGSDDTNGMMGSDGFGGMMSSAGLEGMATMHGAGFDRTFLKMMVRHHLVTLSLAKSEIAHGTSPAARSSPQRSS